ncbi:MAG: hypothetical protein COA84_08690 [Robiginitomaculum sp.]|nr:MAG: hypothetical protein COA84_08690 [Robiginitomaculum sp.]
MNDNQNINNATNLHAIIVRTNADGVITFVNDKFVEISGYERDELIGNTHAIVNSGAHPPKFFEKIWKQISAGKTWRGIIQNKAKDGRFYWVDTTITPDLDATGNVNGYTSIRSDVTRLVTTKTRRKAALKTISALDVKPFNDQGRFKKVYNRVCQWWYDRTIFERIISSNIILVFIMIMFGIAIVVDSNSATTASKEILEHPMAVSNAALSIEKSLFVVAYLKDQAVLRGGEDNFSRYEQGLIAYDTAMRANYYLIYNRYLGDKETINLANFQFLRWLDINKRLLTAIKNGNSENQLIKLSDADLLARRDLEKSIDKILTFAKNKAQIMLEGTQKKTKEANGRTALFIGIAIAFALFVSSLIGRTIASPIKDLARVMHGLAEGKQNIVLPVLRSKRFEAGAIIQAAFMLKSEAEENTYLIKQAERAKDKAELLADAADASNKAKSEFLAMMSHELRTPMNAILGSAHLLKSSELGEEDSEHVRTMIDGSEILMSVLNDILDFSKIEAGKLDISPTEVDVVHLVRRLNRLWEPKAKENGINLVCTIEDDVPGYVKIDGTRLRQVLYNLLSNGIKFTSKGEVRLSVSIVNKKSDIATLHFDVSDTGIGISKKAQSRLFNAFEQADKSMTRRFGGTGLGLAISLKLARLMGGDINVTSQEGEGSCFTVEIPAPIVSQVLEPSDKVNEIVADTPKQARRKLSILAAEDNELNRRVLGAFLKPLKSDLTFAEDGEEALKILLAKPFDVILMDIQMPKMDGTEVVKKIRASNGPNQNKPVIALTANALQGDRETYIAAGMNDYVPKPIDPAKLISAVRTAVSKSRSIANQDKTKSA